VGELRVILSHAGGFVPYAAYRIASFASPRGNPLDGMAQLQKFYFDTALSGSPTVLPSLLGFAKPGYVLFGSDWPYAPDAAQRASIDRRAAEALLPRLALSPSNRV
jgi:predicted TIM-barrel fold metal-dependent hydrolase